SSATTISYDNPLFFCPFFAPFAALCPIFAINNFPHQVISKPTSCLTFFLNNASPAGNNLIPVLGPKAANDNHFHFV
ncbi:TPA: hypothetical protein ACNTAK_004755, partial [Escherichia coli]